MDAGTRSSIGLKILGSKGESEEKLLSETGFQAGSSKKIKILARDVGEITGFFLSINDAGKWKPIEITIKNKSKIIDYS